MTATRIKRVLSIQPVAERGGSDQALLRMVRQLGQAGWDCHVAIPGPSPIAEDFAAAGAALHIVPMRRLTTSGGSRHWLGYALAWPVSVFRLVVLGRRLGVGVVHSNSLHSWYGWAVGRILRRPHIWHAREIVVQSTLALRLERRLLAGHAQLVIAVSAAVADQFADGLEPERLAVVFDEPDPQEFGPHRAGAFRRLVAVAEDAPLVGSVGRIDTWKGVDILLDAVPLLQRCRPDAEVVIAGPPVRGKEAYAEALALRASALPGVRWLGERTDAAELIADLDVFALPSTEPEPFGLGMVEALASGVPVVASAAGGPLEVLGGAAPDAGRLVPPGDAEALACALADLLPAVGSSGPSRRRRPRLRHPTPTRLPELFDGVLKLGVSPRRPRRFRSRRSVAQRPRGTDQ